MRRRALPFVPLVGTLMLAAGACAPERSASPDVEWPLGVNTLVTDATGGGEVKFYWRPPIAPSLSYPGSFDGNASPELRLCRLTAQQTCGTVIATYTKSSSPAIAVSTSAETYSVEWSTKPATITNGDYRAEVRVSGRVMGVADARVVASAKDLRNVPSGIVGVQKGKSLVFAFRLETGIVGSIVIAPKNVFVERGDTVRLIATVRDIHGTTIAGAPVTWTSTDTASATVSSTGLVTTLREDTVVVRAEIGAVSDTTVIPIVRPRVDQVVVNPTPIEVHVGQTATAWAVTYDARGNILTGRLLSWSSSNMEVATVSSAGIVTGVSAGSATISATSEGKVGSSPAIVTIAPPAPVARVDVQPSIAFLTVGQDSAFAAIAYDAANNVLTGRAFTWAREDTAVVSVSTNGLVSAVGPGIAYVSATAEGLSDSARVEVTGASVACLRPWALPEQWFIAEPYGRAIRARYGTPNEFGVVPPGTISGNYYPLALGESGAANYKDNIVGCTQALVTLGAPTPLATGNLVGPTIDALDSLFNLDQGATWDSTANGGRGGIVSSNAPPGEESPRVVLVGLYVDRDQSPGSSYARFRRTAYVFVDTYSRTTNWDLNEQIGDIVFRFLRFGP